MSKKRMEHLIYKYGVILGTYLILEEIKEMVWMRDSRCTFFEFAEVFNNIFTLRKKRRSTVNHSYANKKELSKWKK